MGKSIIKIKKEKKRVYIKCDYCKVSNSLKESGKDRTLKCGGCGASLDYAKREKSIPEDAEVIKATVVKIKIKGNNNIVISGVSDSNITIKK